MLLLKKETFWNNPIPICIRITIAIVSLMGVLRTEEISGRILKSIRIKDMLPQIIKPFNERPKTLILSTSDSLWNNHFLDPKISKHKNFTEMVLIENTFGIFETHNGDNLRIPAIISIDWFYKQNLRQNFTIVFQKKFIELFTKKKRGRRTSASRAVRFNITDIGESEVALNIRGNIDILGQVIFQDQELTNTNYKENQSWDLEIDQRQNFNIEGTIGDRISVLVDQDSEADFSWENDILLNYEGKDDDVLKSVNAGNISLSLPSTKFVTYGSGKSEGLFGIKTVNQLGPLSMTSILSREQVTKSAKTKTGDESASDITINDYNFVKDRYFFIDTTYRKNFYPLSPAGLHYFHFNQDLNQIEYIVSDYKVYKTVSTSQYNAGSIQGTAYFQPNDEESYSVSGSWVELQRDIDYEINQILGYIRMKSPIGNEAIGIAYDINNMDYETKEIIPIGYDSTYTDYDYIPSGDYWNGDTSDVGMDGCSNPYENGIGGCFAELDTSYIENSDPNGDDWNDCGSDNICDEDEFGYNSGSCSDGNSLTEYECIANYGIWTENLDPTGDNYHAVDNPDGTEGNELFDINEGTENNNQYDGESIEIGEPFTDNDGDGIYDPPEEIRLKLLKAKGTSDPSKPTWGLMFKNVYDLGARNIKLDDFELSIIHEKGASGTEQHSPGGNSFINIFGLDRQDQYGNSLPGGDGIIDDLGSIINPAYGEIILPFHMPFAYQETFFEMNVFGDSLFWGNNYPELVDIIDIPLVDMDGDYLDDGDTGPAMYYSTSSNNQEVQNEHEFIFKISHSQRSSTMNLGFMVVEGSEEVILNGRTLTRNVDYTIDYFSGTINFVTDEAMDPTANISVTYEENELVSFDQKLMVGTRMELDLGDNNFLGMTALYYNQTIIDNKVDIGYEPLRNFIWDINGKYSRQFDFLTRAVDNLPFIETTKPSTITIEGEYAQVIPNPNPLGQAFLDDFESSKTTTSPSVMQRQWKIASPPLIDSLGTVADIHSRGEMYWYNPYNDVDTRDIWPDKETSSQAGNNKTKVLTLAAKFTDISQENPWNGITTTLYEGDYNQSDKKFLEIWLNAENIIDDSTTIHIDIGFISEDQNNNSILDMEDEPIIPGTNVGNGILDEGEDTGVDGCVDEYEDGYGGCSVDANPSYISGDDPNNDNWYYTEGSSNYRHINGTEGNSEMAGFTYPDTEDLNRDNNPDFYNSYFTYALQPKVNEGIQSLDNGIPTGWELHTILLSDFEKLSENNENVVDWSDVRYLRLWMDGITPNENEVTKLHIAKLEIVGNKWQELGHANLDSLYILNNPWEEDESFGATVANTEEHASWYSAPPDAIIEEDKLYNIQSKEQSLVLNFEKDGIEPNSIVGIKRSFESLPTDKKNSFFVYDKLKMHVHGIPDDCLNWAPQDSSLVQLIFQFGMDDDNFYEVAKPISCQDTTLWGNKPNYIDINLGAISRKKEGIFALDIFDPNIHDTGIDSVYSEFENGCGGSLPEGLLFVQILDSLDIEIEEGFPPDFYQNIWTSSDGIEIEICGGQYWDIESPASTIDDPNGDDYSDDNLEGTENNESYDIGEPFTDNNNNSELDEAPENYDEDTNIWEWVSGSGADLEITHIRGEPSIDRINFILIGVQNTNSLNSVKGSVLVNEMRFSGVRKTRGHAFRLKTDINFADLLSINSSFERKDSEFRTLQERLGTGTTSQVISINSTLNPDKLLPAQWGIKAPFQMNYSSNTSTPKYKQGTDILVGSVEDAPDSIKTISQSITMSTSFRKTSRSDKWWLKYTLDKFITNLSATLKNSSNITEKSNQTRNYDLTMTYAYQFSNENYWRPLKFIENFPILGKSFAEVKLFWSPKKINSQMKLDEDNNIKLYRNGNENITEKFELTRDFSFTYQLTNSLSSSYSKNIKSNLIDIKNNTEERWNAVRTMNPGIVTNFTESLNNTYSPDNLRWLRPSITYNSSFSWVLNSLVDSLQNANVSSNNTFKTSINFNPKDFIELIYTPDKKSGSSRSTSSRSRGRSSSNRRSSTKLMNVQNPILRSVLKPVHNVMSKFSPISFSYTIGITNAEGNVVANVKPEYSYRFGFSALQNQLFNTDYFEKSGLATHSNGVGSFSNNITHDLSMNSGLNFTSGIIMKFTYLNKETVSRQDGGQETINNTFSLIPIGERGNDLLPGVDKSRVPIPNWDINWSGLQKLPILNKLFSSVSLSHNYRGELSSTEQDGDLKSENYTHQFSPLVGFNLRTKTQNSISINTRISQTLTINNNIQTGSTERNYSNSITADASYSRQGGFYIPIFFFRDFPISNDISFNLRTSYDTSVKSTITITGESSVLQESISFSIKPEITYSFTRWVNGGIHFDYVYTDNMTTGRRTEKDFGFSVKIKIQG